MLDSDGLAVMVASDVTSSVSPSFGAFATATAPTEPLPPARLSTMTFWLRDSVSRCATMRAMVSVTPPGEVGTISRTCPFG